MKSMKSTIERTDIEELLKVLGEKSPVGVCIIQDGKFSYINPSFPLVTGYTADELMGRDSLEIVVPEDKEMVRENAIKMLKGELTSPYQFRVISKDGNIRWVMETVKPIQYRGRRATLGNYMDITKHKQAEEALQESEGKYRELGNSITDVFFAMDEHLRYTYWNRASEILTGIGAEDAIGKSLLEIFPDTPETRRAEKVYRNVLKIQQSQTFVNDFNINDRHYIFEISAYPSRGGISVFVKDITERKRAEEALEKSEERYRQLAENAGEAIFVVQDGVIKFINPKGEELSGYSIGELTSMPFVKFIHSDDIDMVADRNSRRLRGESVPQTYDFRIMRKDGDIRWGELNAVPISWDNRPGVLCFMNDVTERKKAEEALRQSEERYRAILAEIEDSYFEVDLGGHVTFINNSGCRHLGYSTEELMGMSYKRFTAEDYIESVFQVYNEVYRTGVPNKGFHWKIIRKDGSAGFIDSSVVPLRNDKGQIIGFRGVGRDITERRKMEEQLMIADRLASLGELAAGTAHELNNPLTSIIGFSQLLMEKKVPDDILDDLKLIHNEAQRAASVTNNLLTFARRHAPLKQLSRIDNIIVDVLKLRAYEHKINSIEVERRFDPDLPEIMVDYFQMQQVFMNIIINAEYFMIQAHKRGTMTITTQKQRDSVMISFADNGPGIPPENLNRIFDPFFTTKEAGKGTGLGLSICHGIVTEHGGQIYARSELGKGATIFVEVPINDRDHIEDAMKQANATEKGILMVK
jgi:two-component system NtrC family sensor kinase